MPQAAKKTQRDENSALYLIDAYGLIYRSYFAFLSRPLRNAEGRNISALFGFARTLVNLLDEGAPACGDAAGSLQKPRYLAAVFDSRTPTFRHKKYPEYKATRQKAPEDLHSQVPLVEETLHALGVPVLRAEGYEADDIIATLVGRCREEGRGCYIFSTDKDLLQLVGEGVWELRPSKAASTGKGAYELVGPEEVAAEWGVPPDKVLDLLSLAGDSSDNVPGVKGVGDITAAKLVARYGSLDGVYGNIAGIKGALGKKLAEGRESAYFSRSLIALEYKVPLPLKSIEELSVENLDRPAGAKVLMLEGVRQSALALDPLAGNSAGPEKSGAIFPEISRPDAGGKENPVRVDPSLLGEGRYRAVLDIKELEKILALARERKLLALDFETDSLDAWNAHPIGVSLALRPGEAVYVPVAGHRLKAKSGTGAQDLFEERSPFVDPLYVRGALAEILADPAMTVIAHNAKYDYEVSRGWGIPRWRCGIWDTMVAAWLDDPERSSYSLDSLAAPLFGCVPTAYSSIVPDGGVFADVDLDTAVRYSGEDADLTFRMMRYLEERLQKAGSSELFTKIEMPLLPILAEMEGAGIRIEKKALREYGAGLAGELRDIEAQTYKLVGREFNLGSPKQLQEVLFTERRLNPGKKIKTGYSTDMAVLEELARQDPVPALILRHRALSKLKSTYVDTLPGQADSENRLHTHFVQTGTATGRLSSREPNLQNIPVRDEAGRRIREAFTAGPGRVLISADYSQIELAVLAHLSDDENLIAAFMERKDVHVRTAALIFGTPAEEIKPDQRRIAKTINFGVMYGMSAFRLANELGISRAEAASFIEAYFKTYAGVRRYIDGLIKQTEESGFVSTIFGRRRYIQAINSRNKTEKSAAERTAVNTPIQGSAADIVKIAMIKLDRVLVEKRIPAKLLLQVHDELILESPGEDALGAAKLVREVMESAVTLKVPLRVSVETGKRWGDFH
ncbi:MAG: DNA polymerase I [Treponema sp.]|jgi:DNA polymerase-1|nr:DNA polymerase I [Treponema sp.]